MSSELLLGRYRLIETAGRGGFATVEVAWDMRLQRRVAIKRIGITQGSDEAQIAGLAEARTAAMLNDSNIVSVLDFELTDTAALVIMEYIDGPDLATLMRSSTDLFELTSIAAIARDIGDALVHAHKNKVLHLDIKPANILFDPNGYAKVTDFGMAVLVARHGFGQPQGGTIGYMPPEQIDLGAVDERTDLWAFAVLLYQLLVGKNPYQSIDADESLHLIETLAITLPSQARDDLDAEIDRVFISALSADPAWRQPSIRSLLDDLMPLLGSTRSGRYALRRRINRLGLSDQDNEEFLSELNSSLHFDESQPADRTSNDQDDDGQPEPRGFFSGIRSRQRTRNQGAVDTADTASDHDADSGYEPDEPDDEPKEEKAPLWLRIQESSRRRLTRLTAAICAMATAYFGLTGFGLLGAGGGGVATGEVWHPVGGTIQNSLTGASSSVQHISSATLQTHLIILIGILCLVGLVALMAPTLGGAISMLIICAGVFSRGLVVIAFFLLVFTVLWWLFLGRRGWSESALLTAVIPLGWLFASLCLPVMAACQQKPMRALGTTLSGWALMMLTSGLTTPSFYLLPSERLFSMGAVINHAAQQFPPTFWEMLTTPINWLSLILMLLTCSVMLLFSQSWQLPEQDEQEPDSRATQRRQAKDTDEQLQEYKSHRRRLTVGAVLATILLALGLMVVPLLYGSVTTGVSAWSLIVRVAITLVIMLVLIRSGVFSSWRTELSDE